MKTFQFVVSLTGRRNADGSAVRSANDINVAITSTSREEAALHIPQQIAEMGYDAERCLIVQG